MQSAEWRAWRDQVHDVMTAGEATEDAVVRFARFDEKFYKGTLGRPDARRVVTSNLTEVWDLTIQQAAERSGYTYKGGGDTLFIWVYVP